MEYSMIVGFDAKRIVRNGTGLGSYGRTLTNDLAAIGKLDLRLYAPDKGRDDLRLQVPERDNLHYAYPLSSFPGPFASLYKSWWRSRGIVGQLQNDGIQVFHGLSGELPVGIRQTGIKTVVTIHDLIFMRHPEYYNWMDVQIYKHKFFKTLQEADRIVAISECTRRDISELGGIPQERIDLIYQSCASRFSAQADERLCMAARLRYGLPERYVLCVGTIEERKNTLLALRSLHWLPDDIHLVLVGRATPYARKVMATATNENLDSRLHLLHGISDQDLPALYAQAEAFVYPSRYEGFGIPIIEAIRMGLPVVACTGSCLEEAGGPDNLYVDPDDAEAMAMALQKVLRGSEGRGARIERSRDYVCRFENTGAAQRFADLYDELVGR
jgi:glycosyltransferase involved in cell wall biosynthesis